MIKIFDPKRQIEETFKNIEEAKVWIKNNGLFITNVSWFSIDCNGEANVAGLSESEDSDEWEDEICDGAFCPQLWEYKKAKEEGK